MPKRKATQFEIEEGIGETEIEDEGIEPEDADEEKITALAADEENEMDDEALIAEYHRVKNTEKEGD